MRLRLPYVIFGACIFGVLGRLYHMHQPAARGSDGGVRRANPDSHVNSDPAAPLSAGPWDSAKSVVIGVGIGYPVTHFRMFVGSLRATGFCGHIIMGVGVDADSSVIQYLTQQNVTIRRVEFTKCTFTNYTTNTGKPSTFNQRQKCALGYPDYKIQWGRFPLAAEWLKECTECTDGVMLSDVRDAYFQRDPFAAVTHEQAASGLMLFEEHPMMTTKYWLVEYIVKQCKGYEIGERPMLCSGSTMGSREGILLYIAAMVAEFDAWLSTPRCRFDIVGDDQSIHDHLYYTGQLPHATVIPYRTGPIHVVGGPADKIFRAAIDAARQKGKSDPEGWVNANRFYGSDAEWRNWLGPDPYNLTNFSTGFITNLDGSPSPQVHQFDRFGRPFDRWLQKMVHEWNS